jgi:predicted benzoate:H+ symporter BenE
MLMESLFFDTFLAIAGNPIIIGIAIFLIFVIFAVAMRIGNDALLILMVPIFILVGVFIPQLAILMVIAVGVTFGLALIKLTRG